MSNTRKATPKQPVEPKVAFLSATVTVRLVEVAANGDLTEMPPLEITVPGKDWSAWASQAFTPDALSNYRQQYLAALAEREAQQP